MKDEECFARASEVGEEVKAVLGEGFVVGTFLRACQQPRVLLSRIELFGEAVPVALGEIGKDDYREVIVSRVVKELKRQTVLLQDAVKKLEASNVKPS